MVGEFLGAARDSVLTVVGCPVFFFKQKTAYEMRISDWSSDVCSSDLAARLCRRKAAGRRIMPRTWRQDGASVLPRRNSAIVDVREIGRASCRERVCQYV